MTMLAADLRSGKSHGDENFPVASRLIHARHRAPILAFYEFVRTADDVADHPELPAEEKLRLLDHLEAGLGGLHGESGEANALRVELQTRGLSPLHAQHLLIAFRMDATKRRYANWDELIHYCTYSAMPVGRFVLDVHGEGEETWAASDALCAALQVINHLQDCARDYRHLDRVYLPLDALTAAGAQVEDLAAVRATPELRSCLAGLSRRTVHLLERSAPLPGQVKSLRLALEISAIQALAQRLLALLNRHDPLCQRVHLNKSESAWAALAGIVAGVSRRWSRPRPATPESMRRESP